MPNSGRVIRGVPDNTYRVVRNLHSTVLNHGDCVLWLETADTPPTGFTWIPGVDVKLSGTANSVKRAGIVRLTAAQNVNGVGQGEYFTIQVSGFHAAAKTTVSTLAAPNTVNANSDGKLVAGAAADDPSARVGVVIKTAVNGLAGVEINCQ